MSNKGRTESERKGNIITYVLVVLTGISLMAKSMFFLAMLRTPNSAGINFKTMYFQSPPLWAHIAFVVIVVSGAFLFETKGRNRYLLIVNIIVTLMLIADIWYYRANGTFLSLRHIFNPEIFNPLNKQLFNPEVVDILLIADFASILILAKNDIVRNLNCGRNIFAFAASFVISVIVVTASHYYIDVVDGTKGEKMLFRIAWAPFQTMSNMSPIGYHGYDIYKTIYDKNAVSLSAEDKEEISNWFKNNKEALPDNQYKGIFKGKNLIFIQVESLEDMVIGQKANGQEITPNLNRLLKNSLYFNGIHEQNNIGTSSDADLMVNTSLLPIRDSATFFTKPAIDVVSLPKILNEMGYNTISSHPEVAGNWNWAEAHKGILGFNQVWDITKFNVEEVIGLGISDGAYLSQVADKLKTEKQPFYAYMITLTSHGPFDMPEDKKYLKLPEGFDKTILGAYFQAIRYTDEQIGNFIKKLDEEGILDNSVVVIYGDHTGVHKFYSDKLKDIHFEGDWWKPVWQPEDRKVPLLMYSKNFEGNTIGGNGGQIDIFPTIAYLMGIDSSKYEGSVMGRVLVNTNRNATVLNYGEIVGVPKDTAEKKLLEEAREVADKYIRGK